ncbi:hypothetical protein, partial [Burkholderia sp. Ac-20384]|uniref:hypothetical protein n=1 Tax=Burkholderia sp. Ac-20384 TaxID=2703902 RepID=UPI00197F2BBB
MAKFGSKRRGARRRCEVWYRDAKRLGRELLERITFGEPVRINEMVSLTETTRSAYADRVVSLLGGHYGHGIADRDRFR